MGRKKRISYQGLAMTTATHSRGCPLGHFMGSHLLIGRIHDGLSPCLGRVCGRVLDVDLDGNALCGAGVGNSGTHELHGVLKFRGHGPGVQGDTARLQFAGIVKHVHVDPGHGSDLQRVYGGKRGHNSYLYHRKALNFKGCACTVYPRRQRQGADHRCIYVWLSQWQKLIHPLLSAIHYAKSATHLL